MNVLSLLVAVSCVIFAGCTGIPRGVRAVENVDMQRYQGTWYEIARLDHRFERGLTHVTATYAPRDDGGIAVHNRGYDVESGQWKSVQGRAYFVGEADTARLKVTFFWPFYGAYNVIALDRDAYSYAMVCGPSRGYLWILARERALPDPILDDLTAQALRLGFRPENLIFVPQQSPPPLSSANAGLNTNTPTANGSNP